MLLLTSIARAVFLEADKVTILVRSLNAVNFSLSMSHSLTNHEDIPLKADNPKHKLHVISNKEFKCDSFSQDKDKCSELLRCVYAH